MYHRQSCYVVHQQEVKPHFIVGNESKAGVRAYITRLPLAAAALLLCAVVHSLCLSGGLLLMQEK